MASTVSIIISASATRALAAFGLIRAALSRMAGMASSAASTIGKVAPYAVLAAKVLLVVGAITTLTGVIANLLGAIQLLAPAAAAGGLAMLTLKMGLSGVQDALEAGLSGDVEKFEKALKKLEPAARDAVRMIVKLRDEWKPLQQRVQGELFAGAAGELKSLSGFIRPIAERWLPRLAMKFAEVRNAIANGIAKYAADGRLEAVWINISDAVGKLAGVIPHLGRAFGDVLEVAAPAFNQVAGGIENMAKKFSDWIRMKKEDGSLKKWLDQAMEAFRTIGRIAENVGGIIGAIFKGANEEGQGFLEKLERITQQMEDWFNSSDGQKLIESISSIVGWLIACEPAFSFLANLMSDRLKELGALWTGMKEIAQGVINWILSGYIMLLTGAEKAFGWIPGLGPKLKSAKEQFESWKNSVNESIDGIKKTVDITVNYRARMIGNHLVSGAQQSGTYSSGIGGRASGGIASGLTWVGERGPELVDFSQGRVHNAGASRNMPVGNGGGSTVIIAPGDNADSKLASALIKVLRVVIRNDYGGDVQAALGRA